MYIQETHTERENAYSWRNQSLSESVSQVTTDCSFSTNKTLTNWILVKSLAKNKIVTMVKEVKCSWQGPNFILSHSFPTFASRVFVFLCVSLSYWRCLLDKSFITYIGRLGPYPVLSFPTFVDFYGIIMINQKEVGGTFGSLNTNFLLTDLIYTFTQILY